MGFVSSKRALALALTLPLACARGEQPPPNLLLIVVDALRADHLGAYGYPLPTSPHIDRLAAASVVFEHAFAHSTWTKPSVATLLTSLYPSQHGLGHMAIEADGAYRAEALSRRHLTLAEQLRQRGYATAAFGANVHLQRKTGFAQGFDRFESVRLLTASELAGRFRSWIEAGGEGGGGEPFFAYLHLMDAHWPYDRRLPAAPRFGDLTMQPEPPESWQAVAGWAAVHLGPANLAALTARYDEEIAFLDAALGVLLAWLETRGLDERTVVVLTADHGEGLYEHGELQHSFRPYEEVTHVPLLVRFPARSRIRLGRVVEPVGLIDLAPTLLELAGAPPLPAAAGTSLVPLLRGRGLEHEALYLEGGDARAMRDSRHKLLAPGTGEASCFALEADPGETAPLAPPWPPPCEALAAALAEHEARLGPARATASETAPLTSEEVEELRSLGYIGD